MKELENFCSEMTKLKLRLDPLYKEAFGTDWSPTTKIGTVYFWFNDFIGMTKNKKAVIGNITLPIQQGKNSFEGEGDIGDNCFLLALKDAINKAILYIETQQNNRQTTVAQLDFWTQLYDGLTQLSNDLIRP